MTFIDNEHVKQWPLYVHPGIDSLDEAGIVSRDHVGIVVCTVRKTCPGNDEEALVAFPSCLGWIFSSLLRVLSG